MAYLDYPDHGLDYPHGPLVIGDHGLFRLSCHGPLSHR